MIVFKTWCISNKEGHKLVLDMVEAKDLKLFLNRDPDLSPEAWVLVTDQELSQQEDSKPVIERKGGCPSGDGRGRRRTQEQCDEVLDEEEQEHIAEEVALRNEADEYLSKVNYGRKYGNIGIPPDHKFEVGIGTDACPGCVWDKKYPGARDHFDTDEYEAREMAEELGAPNNFKLEEELQQSALLKARLQFEDELRRKAAAYDYLMKFGIAVPGRGYRVFPNESAELKRVMDDAVASKNGNPD